jgi:hypothetical protein
VFGIYLKTDSDLCHLHRKLIGFHNREERCLLRGTNWVFKQSSLSFVVKGLIWCTRLDELYKKDDCGSVPVHYFLRMFPSGWPPWRQIICRIRCPKVCLTLCKTSLIVAITFQSFGAGRLKSDYVYSKYPLAGKVFSCQSRELCWPKNVDSCKITWTRNLLLRTHVFPCPLIFLSHPVRKINTFPYAVLFEDS